MNPARIPTQAEHQAMQRLNAAYYAKPASNDADFQEPELAERPNPNYSETRVCVYFVIAAAFIFAARYMGVFA